MAKSSWASDDSDGQHEAFLPGQDGNARHPRKTSWRPTLWQVVACIALFLMGTVAGIGISVLGGASLHKDLDKAQSQLSRSPVPDMPTEEIMFVEDKMYSAPSADDTDFEWNKMLPQGRGFVFVPDGEEYGLPPGVKTDYDPIYSVAMFHQMHCLGQIRKIYWVFRDAISMEELGIAKKFTGRQGHHVQHCLDYLRQSILCAGDMTLEWPMLEGVAQGLAVDGWDIPHQCKSRTAIMDYMERMHYNGSMSNMIAG